MYWTPSDIWVLHNDITASSRTNRSVMPYHPSRLVTSPLHYMEMSLSLGGEKLQWLEWAPPFPSWLNGARRQAKSEVLNFFCESGWDEMLFNEGTAFDDALLLCLQEVQLLDNVGIFLIILMVAVDIGEESPVIEVVDGVLKNGVCGSIAPEATTEPGGERLHRLVRGVVRGGIQFDDLCLLLSLSSTVKSHHPSIIKLLDEAGKLFSPIIKGDGEVRKAFSILLVSRWTFAEVIVVIIHPLLKCRKIGLEPLNLLPMDIVSDPDGGSKSGDNGPELVWGQIRCGSEDVLHRGGREGEPPRVSGGESNSRTFFSDFTHSKGIIHTKAKVSGEAGNVLFRGCNVHWSD